MLSVASIALLVLLQIGQCHTQTDVPQIEATGNDLRLGVNEGGTVKVDVGDLTYDLVQALDQVKQLSSLSYSSAGTVNLLPDEDSFNINFGTMSANDAPKVTLSLSGCNTDYSLHAAIVSGNTCFVTSSQTSNSDESDANFWQYVSFNGCTVGNTRSSFSLAIATSTLAPTCTTFSYTYTLTSVVGGVEISDARTCNTPMTVHPLASYAGVEALGQQQILMVKTQQNLTNQLKVSQLKAVAMETKYQNLSTLVASLTVTVDNSLGCHSLGQILGADGICRHVVPICKDPDNGVTLVHKGDAVPGTTASIDCGSGKYDSSGGATCLQNATWSPINKDCRPCPSSCVQCTSMDRCTKCKAATPILSQGVCGPTLGTDQLTPSTSCAAIMAEGFGNGLYWVKSPSSGRVYKTFCLNNVSTDLGWTDVAGGGWEIVHTNMGGNNLPRNAVSNRAMRTATAKTAIVMPMNLTDSSTHKSQLSEAFMEHIQDKDTEWIKFTAVFTNDVPTSQHNIHMSIPSPGTFAWFFTALTITRKGTYDCIEMPSKVSVKMNGVSVGSTSYAIYNKQISIGLATVANDNCGQSTNNLIDSKGKTSFKRSDDSTGSTDNAVRHLVSYNDVAGGRDASRCNSCCWGCADTREVYMWGVRKL